jgi:hypothetical protein
MMDVFFWDRVSWTICPGLAENHDPPDLYILSSYNYSCEPPERF